MIAGLYRIWPRRRTIVVAATGNIETLKALWATGGADVQEARTTDGIHRLLDSAQLVVLDPEHVVETRLDLAYIQTVLASAGIPHPSSQAFLAAPEKWLQGAKAFGGDLRSLPPRTVAFTSMASGGVGKTTLTLCLALSFVRRTGLPAAIIELTHAASGFLSVLDEGHFDGPVPDAHAVATQGELPGAWSDGRAHITVVPMDGKHAALLSPGEFGELLQRMRRSAALTIVDAVQPHPLWPPVADAVDLSFLVAAADRPDTVANAQVLAAETGSTNVRVLINMAGAADRLAGRLSGSQVPVLTVPRKSEIARYTDRLPQITAEIWPGIRL
jgi:hypothetical protein